MPVGRTEPIPPMLASTGKMPRDQDRWAFEVKWDGVRAILQSTPDGLRVWSRSGNEITDGYPELQQLHPALGSREAVLDGEIIAFDDEGRPSFQALQRRMHVRGPQLTPLTAAGPDAVPVVLMLFDVLALDGESLVRQPYDERHQALVGLGLNGPHWQTLPAHHGDGNELLAATAEQGLEGVIAKRRDAPYSPGRRTDAWIKIKNEHRQEFVIGGWLPGRGGRQGVVGSLQVGVYDESGQLRYAGGVGTGFGQDELKRLTAVLTERERDTSPFVGRQPPPLARFVAPELICEVRFSGWTADGSVRQASYLGLRNDKDPKTVVREDPVASIDRSTDAAGAVVTREPPPPDVRRGPAEPDDLGELIPDRGRSVAIDVGGRTISLSNLEKPLYPTGFTKADVLRYYARIAPILLPHLHDRPVTLKRFPDGVEGKSFFEKHANRHRPEWVQTARVLHSAASGAVDYVLVQDLPTLLWAANLAAIELHPSLSTASPIGPGEPSGEDAPGVGGPTSLVFDLDPGPGTSIVECCRIALTIRGLLHELGLDAVAKTSGSKGLQVYVPLGVDTSYERSRPFAHAVATLLETRQPDTVVSRMAKALRPGRVLIDWSQNSSHKTTVGVYSLRARASPTVSTPVTWSEVEACNETGDPGDLVFVADEVLERVRTHGDLFRRLLTLDQTLPELSE